MPGDLTIGQFVFVLRRRLALGADKALFIFLGTPAQLPPSSQLMREAYAQHADKSDGFLYVTYSGESTFGAGDVGDDGGGGGGGGA